MSMAVTTAPRVFCTASPTFLAMSVPPSSSEGSSATSAQHKTRIGLTPKSSTISTTFQFIHIRKNQRQTLKCNLEPLLYLPHPQSWIASFALPVQQQQTKYRCWNSPISALMLSHTTSRCWKNKVRIQLEHSVRGSHAWQLTARLVFQTRDWPLQLPFFGTLNQSPVGTTLSTSNRKWLWTRSQRQNFRLTIAQGQIHHN